MIEISNLSHTYKSSHSPALNDINLCIPEGEYIALIGPNGCGKTTLIRHLNALLLPSQGEISIDGFSTLQARHHAEIRRRVGMVFQNPDNQIVGMSVEEDVAFGPGNLRLPSAEIRLRVDRALEMVGLQGFEKRLPSTLSGGEKQLLALAGLLAMEPGYIVLDEATSSLDAGSRAKVLSIIKRLVNANITVIHVTHNLEEALQANRVILMAAGHIVADGPASQIITRAELLQSVGLTPPLIIDLMARLNSLGCIPDRPVATVGDAVDAIVAWFNKRSENEAASLSQEFGSYA